MISPAKNAIICTIEDVELIADTLETSIEVVYAGQRELAQVGLEPSDFVLYHHPWTEYPHVLDTCKLIALDWVSTDPETAMARTVDESLTSGRRGAAHDPGRDAEEILLELITD
ncbi:hypothetical protein [Haloterrigena salifodinae]|uniref:hypothetical protein n=1 Tax=Haloterrigena salifodinae TaxID=2675099 RepID=UPI000F89C18D|nr:hypothetical protein [Haloterrigena salifodinae]